MCGDGSNCASNRRTCFKGKYALLNINAAGCYCDANKAVLVGANFCKRKSGKVENGRTAAQIPSACAANGRVGCQRHLLKSILLGTGGVVNNRPIAADACACNIELFSTKIQAVCRESSQLKCTAV